MNYKIEGGNLPLLTIELEENESINSEGGAMCWMTPNMEMKTTTNGGVGKLLGRALSGETLMQNIYTAKGGPGSISIASNLPGEIKVFEIKPGSEMIFQKGGYLCSTRGVELSMHFRKKIGAGLFGGEGFILQKISGEGLAFAEFDGYVVEKTLADGEQIIVDTGNLAAMSATCKMDIKTVPGLKNMVFGGEGLFNTVITGPGVVYLQSMPIMNLAGAIAGYLPVR